MFETIVVGFDGSEVAERALRTACDLADRYSAELHVVHSPQSETAIYAAGAIAGFPAVVEVPSPEEIRKAGEAILERARQIAAETGQADAAFHLMPGEPADEVLRAAEMAGADLIVTGRRGLGNIAGLLLGSTSQKITHHAKCAVLSVI